MRKTTTFFLLALLMLGGTTLFGQNVLEQDNSQIHFGSKRIGNIQDIQSRGTVNCGPDTLEYALFKASGLRGITLNNVSSAQAAAQYYDAPGDVTISGIRFYAYYTGTAGISTTVTAEIYAVGPDSIPTGTPLATAQVVVDTTFGGGAIAALERIGNFASPITVNQPYAVVVTNASPNNIAMICSDYVQDDGAGEYLGFANISGQWLYGYQLVLGADDFNADWTAEPMVTFDNTPSFMSTDCYEVNTQLDLTNTSSDFNFNRMYSLAAALGIPEVQFTWDFGDGSGAVTAIDTFVTYTTGGMSYTVTLQDSLFGWTSGICASDTSKTLIEGVVPQPSYTFATSATTVSFTDASTGGTITSYAWDFGDGNTSTMQNPTHIYAADGNYTVCLTITNACGNSTFCDSVVINTVGFASGLDQAVNIYPNPASELVKIDFNLLSEEDVVLNIYTLHGALIRSESIGLMQAGQHDLNISDLPNGTYAVEFRTENARSVKKIQILH